LDFGRYNKSGQGYKGPYMIEVENIPMGASVKGRKPSINPPTRNEGYAVSHRPINIDEVKFYKEHWLKGYKEIHKPINDLSPLGAAKAKAERMLSQKHKFSSINKDAISKFKNIEDNFIIDESKNYSYPANSLGVNNKEKAVLFSDAEQSKNKLTMRQQAYISAHETDHFYKNSAKEAKNWLSAFDTKLLGNYLKGKPIYSGTKGVGVQTSKGKLLSIGNAEELRARAGQLKDFIAREKGIPLNKNFKVKRKDLDNALENFVNKTELDNDMTQFIYSIKDKKKLLKNMNKYPLSLTIPATYGLYKSNKK
jgi:hypothetical protein